MQRLLVLVAITIGSFAAASEALAQPRTIFDYKDAGPGMNKNVPKHPLMEEDLQRWARWLQASDEQYQFMLVMYERFVERHNAFLDREAPRYCAQSAELRNAIIAEGTGLTPIIVDLVKKMDQANVRMRRDLIATEYSLIESIEPILTDQQLERLPTIRDESTRRNCRTFGTTGRWAGIELRDIWENTGASLCDESDLAVVESLLSDYERRLTTLIVRQSDSEFEYRRIVQENALAMKLRKKRGEEGMARYAQIMGRRQQTAQRVRRLHEQTLHNISVVISPRVANSFVSAAKEAAYPEVYPDRDQLHSLFESILDIHHDDALMEAMRVLYDDYRAGHSRMCAQIENVCNEWGEQNEGGVIGYEPQFLRATIKPLLQQRTDLSLEWLTRISEAFGAELLEQHKSEIPAAFLNASESPHVSERNSEEEQHNP